MLPAHIPLLDAYVKNTCHDLDIESELFETTYYHQDNESSEDYRVKIGQILPSKSIHEYIGGPNEAINDFRNKVLEFHPDIIGVSVTDFTHRIGERLIEGHREWYSKPHICVVGGVFASFGWEYLLKFGQYDLILRLEGFISMAHICTHWNDDELWNCPNAVYQKDGITIHNPLVEPVDINTLPFPNYELFPHWRMQRPMGGKIFSMYNCSESVGCFGNCAICCAPRMFAEYKKAGHCYARAKTSDRIVQELHYAIDHYGAEYIYFSSETFMLGNPEKYRLFMQKYEKEIHLPFWCEARVQELLQDGYAEMLKNAGIDRISCGLECGNEEYRTKKMGKTFTNEQFIHAVQKTREQGVKMTLNAVLGCPDETRETIFDTIKLMKQVAEGDPGISLSASVYCPCYGSKFRDTAKEKHYFDPEKWDSMEWGSFHMTPIALDNPTISADETRNIYKCFTLYTKMPFEYWERIQKAETDNAEFEEMLKIFNNRFRDIIHMSSSY